MCRNGPIVWEGVSTGTSVLHRGSFAPAQHDVVAVAQRPLLDGAVVVVGADHPVTGLLIADGVEDRVLEEERVAGEEHLGDQPRRERGAEEREVDVSRAPRVRVVLPGVRPWLDRDELVAPVVIGHAAPAPAEVRVERSRMLIALMAIAPAGIRLPDLDQRVAHRLSVSIEQAAMDDDALADRLAVVLAGE